MVNNLMSHLNKTNSTGDATYLHSMLNINDEPSLNNFSKGISNEDKISLYRTLLASTKYIHSLNCNKVIKFFSDLAKSLFSSGESLSSLAKVLDEYLLSIKNVDEKKYRKIVLSCLNYRYILHTISASSEPEEYYRLILGFKTFVGSINIKTLLIDNKFTKMLTNEQILCIINNDITTLTLLVGSRSETVTTYPICIGLHIGSNFVNTFHILVEHREILEVDCRKLLEVSMDEITNKFKNFYKNDIFHSYIMNSRFTKAFKILIGLPQIEPNLGILLEKFKVLFVRFLGLNGEENYTKMTKSRIARYLYDVFTFLFDDIENAYKIVVLFFLGGDRTKHELKYKKYFDEALGIGINLDCGLIIKILAHVVNKNDYYYKIISLLLIRCHLPYFDLEELDYGELVFLTYFGYAPNLACIEFYNDIWLNNNKEYRRKNLEKLHYLIYSFARANKKKDDYHQVGNKKQDDNPRAKLEPDVKSSTELNLNNNIPASKEPDTDPDIDTDTDSDTESLSLSLSSGNSDDKSSSDNYSSIMSDDRESEINDDVKPTKNLSYKSVVLFPAIGQYIQNRQFELINRYDLENPRYPNKTPISFKGMINSNHLNNLYSSYNYTEFPYPRPLTSIPDHANVILARSLDVLYAPPDLNSEYSTWRCGYSLIYCQNKYREQTANIDSLYSMFKDTSMCVVYNIGNVEAFEQMLIGQNSFYSSADI